MKYLVVLNYVFVRSMTGTVRWYGFRGSSPVCQLQWCSAGYIRSEVPQHIPHFALRTGRIQFVYFLFSLLFVLVSTI